MTTPTEDRSAVASRKIRFLIETNHLTLPRLAEIIGVTRSSLQSVVDRRAVPSPTLIRKLARHFEVPEDFFGEIPDPEPGGAGSSAANEVPDMGKAATQVIRKESHRPAAELNLKALAVRYQALIELLVKEGVITAFEYHEMIERVEQRR